MLSIGIVLAAGLFGNSSGFVASGDPGGRWEGDLSETRCGHRGSEGDLCLRITLQRGSSAHRTTWHLDIPVDRLDGLSARSSDYSKEDVHFELKRPAGTLSFEGGFDGGFGTGEFVFHPDRGYRRDLDRGDDARMSDSDLLAEAIRDSDYESRHEVARTDADDDEEMDGDVDDVDDDIDVDIDLGLGPNFVRQMVNVGVNAVKAVNVGEIVSSAVRAVNPGFVSDLVRSSLDRIDVDELVALGDAWQPHRHRHHHRTDR